MVGVAQLVECKIVILVVVGSIPIVHPIFRAPDFRRPGFQRKGTGSPVCEAVTGKAVPAKVAELVDAPDLGSGIFDVRVRVSPFAP